MTENKNTSFNKSSIVAICLLAIATLFLVFCIVGRYSDGVFKAICNFFVGTFGMAIYGIWVAIITGSTLYLVGKRITIPLKYALSLVALYVLIVLIVHMLSTTFLIGFSYQEYVKYCYNFYDQVPTFGGVFFGSIVYVLQASTTIWGASFILIALLALDLLLVVNFVYALATHKLILNGEISPKKNREKIIKDKKSKDKRAKQQNGGIQLDEDTPTYTQEDIDDLNRSINRPLNQPVDDLSQTPEAREKAYNILFEKKNNAQRNEYQYAQQSTLEKYDPNKPFALDNDYLDTSSSTTPSYSTENAMETLFGGRNETNEQTNGYQSNKSTSSTSSSSNSNERPSYEKYRRVDVTADGRTLPVVPLYDDENSNNQRSYSNDNPYFNDSVSNDGKLDSTDLFVEQEQPKSPFVDNIIPDDNVESKTNSTNSSNRKDTSKVADLTADPIINDIPEDYYYKPIQDDDEQVSSRDAQPENIYYKPQSNSDTSQQNDNIGSFVDSYQDLQSSQNGSNTDNNSSFVAEDYNSNSQFDQPTIETPVVNQSSVQSAPKQQPKSNEQSSESNKVHKYAKYVQPPMELLAEQQANQDMDQGFRQMQADAIVKKLAVFGIKTEALEPIVGASVTQFRLKVLSDKTRMSDFKTYADDLKSCLEARDDIRIEAPIPGSNLVGIEVANRKKSPVVLRSILQSKAFNSAKGSLVFALGQNITGENIVADLADMPHLLVAGTTGSGKSVVLNCMIVSLIYKYSPEYLRFIMVDPKFVELSRYNGLPHMLTSEAITATSDALATMDFLIKEMEARYQLFRDAHVGNIKEYNNAINTKLVQKMPYIVLIVDELSDLMSTNKKALEAKIIRLTQKARAAGIHLVLATQRPSVDVITGLIKANLPSRIALKVGSSQDSRTILDYGGAEKLLGKGDMLFVSSDSPTQKRIQGAYVANDEIRQIVEFARSQNEAYFPEEAYKSIFVSQQPVEEEHPDVQETKNQLDPLCKTALYIWLTKNNGKASIASIQRALPIGFNRAGKIFDSLIRLGCIEDLPANESNSKPRRVLVKLEELDNLFPDQTIDYN